MLLTGGEGGPDTRANYQAFFGSHLSRREFSEGLTDESIEFITKV